MCVCVRGVCVCVCVCVCVQVWALLCITVWQFLARAFFINWSSTPSSNAPCFAPFPHLPLSPTFSTHLLNPLFVPLPPPSLPWMQHYKISEPEMKTSSLAHCIATRISPDSYCVYHVFSEIWCRLVNRCGHTVQCRWVLCAEVVELALHCRLWKEGIICDNNTANIYMPFKYIIGIIVMFIIKCG